MNKIWAFVSALFVAIVVSQEELAIAENSFKQGNISSQSLGVIRHIHENYPCSQLRSDKVYARDPH